jgi:hypothetical protein
MVRESREVPSLPRSLVIEAVKPVGIVGNIPACEKKSANGSESRLIRAEVRYWYEMKVGLDASIYTQSMRLERFG